MSDHDACQNLNPVKRPKFHSHLLHESILQMGKQNSTESGVNGGKKLAQVLEAQPQPQLQLHRLAIIALVITQV